MRCGEAYKQKHLGKRVKLMYKFRFGINSVKSSILKYVLNVHY